MGLNKKLLTYTIIFNVINGLLFVYATTNPGGEVGMQMFFGFPLFYVVGLIGLLIIGVNNKKDFGRPGNWILCLFCTPIPTVIIVSIALRTIGTENGARGAMTMYNYKDGQKIKMQRWEYGNGQTYVDKYYKADSIKELIDGESAFLKDSIWIYYNKDGQILKNEKYKDDKLIRTE